MEKKNFFKRFLVVLIIIFAVNYAFAGSCILVAPSDITKVECSNNNVIGYHVLSTLMNEKKSMIVTSVSDGDATLSVYLKHKKCDYKVSVHNGKLEIKGDSTIKILPIDLPPELETSEDVK